AWVRGARIVARRIAPTGVLLDQQDIEVGGAAAMSPAESLAAAFDGRAFLLAWTSRDGREQIVTSAARVLVDGTLQDGAGLAVESSSTRGATGSPSTVALASDGRGRWLLLRDSFDPAPPAETVRVSSRL